MLSILGNKTKQKNHLHAYACFLQQLVWTVMPMKYQGNPGCSMGFIWLWKKSAYLLDLGFISALGRLHSPFLTAGKKSLNRQIKYALVQCWRHSNYWAKLSTNPLLSCIIYINLSCLYYMKKYNFSIEKKIRMCIND